MRASVMDAVYAAAPERARRPDSWTLTLAGLLLLSLALRCWQAASALSGLAWVLDEAGYFSAAVRFARGETGLPASGVSTPVFTGLLGLWLAAVGETPLAARLGVAVVGAPIAPLTAAIGRAAGGTRTGLLAGFLAALWPPLVYWTGLVMTEALATLFFLAVVWLLWRRSPPAPGIALLAGGLIALVSLTRPTLLVVLPLALVWTLAGSGQVRARLLAAGLIVIAYCAVLVPWWSHQYTLQGEFVPATIKTGDVLLGANNPATYAGADGFGWIRPDVLPDYWQPGWERLTEAERDRRRTAAAVRFALDNRDRLPTVMFWRTLDYWQLHLGQQRQDRSGGPQTSAVFQAGYFVVLALAATGAGVWAIRFGRGRWLLILLAHGWLNGLLFWGGGGRFRIPFEPFLLILAAAGALTLAGRPPPLPPRLSRHRARL